MASDDLTTQILIQIRDEIRGTNQRVDRMEQSLAQRIDILGDRVSSLTTRIDQVGERSVMLSYRLDALGDRQREDAVRLTTEMHEVTTLLKTVIDRLISRQELDDRVANCEREIVEIKARLG